MAIIITDECINCGACEPECPNDAIYMGIEIYEIDPNKCTECVGHFDAPQCRQVCPVDCIPLNPNYSETQEQLLEKYKKKIEDAHMEKNQILNSEKKETEIFIQESENKFEQLILNKKKSLEQKLDQMKVKAIKDMQNISNKIALEAVKKIISNSANDEKMKVINQKNLEKIFINLTNTKAS